MNLAQVLTVLIICVRKLFGDIDELVPAFRAKIREFPFLVSIRLQGLHFCAGSILNSRFIITSAQCFCSEAPIDFLWKPQYSDMYSIHYGETFLDEKPELFTTIEIVYCHEEFRFHPYFPLNDIAVVEVVKLPPDGYWMPALFGTESFTEDWPKEDERFKSVTAGWGGVKSTSILTSLHKLYIQIYGDKLCYEIYEIGNVYCTDAQIDENENCYGDLGSPLVRNNVVIGVFTGFLLYCNDAEIGRPPVFTKVSKYFDWIKAKIRL